MYRVVWELADGETQDEKPETDSIEIALIWLAETARKLATEESEGFNWIQIETISIQA